MPYNRVIIKGTAPGGEVWSSGFALAGVGGGAIPSTSAELTAMAQEIATQMQAWAPTHALRSCLSTLLSVTEVRCERRDENEVLEAFGVYQGAPIVQGSQASNKMHSTSVCISLRTLIPGGKGRGRMYWPAISLSLDGSTLRVPSATRTAILADLKIFLNSVIADAAPGFELELVVRSVTFHQSYLVKSLQCGDVPDVQRRRRDELPEVYTVTTFGSPA